MTAVEWLLENLNSEPYSEEEFKYNSDCWDKALEMEKQQMKYAYLTQFEMQCIDPNCDGINKKGCCIPSNKPKLDKDGCLIFKNKNNDSSKMVDK
jgi:hypothetical protein